MKALGFNCLKSRAFRDIGFEYQLASLYAKGWSGTITSSGGVIEAAVVFDTRTDKFSVEAAVKLDLGSIELTIFGKYKAGGCGSFGAKMKIKKYPKFLINVRRFPNF